MGTVDPDMLGCVLPTSRICDLIWEQATVQIPPHIMTADSHMADTSRMAEYDAAVTQLVDGRRGLIENIDSTLIAEEPRVMKHAPAMKAQIAAALGIQPDAVGIKATTNEAMGFIGRREGTAAMAVASVGMG